MNKQRALLLGITAGVVIVGGIITTVLLYQATVTIAAGQAQSHDTTQPKSVGAISGGIWFIGLVYILPGICGLVAAFLQNKCVYVITCIFTMISLLIMGLVVMIAGMALIVLILSAGSITDNCIDTGDQCKCRFDSQSTMGEYEYKDSPFKTCAYFEKFIALSTALFLFVILTWVAEVVQFIFSCYFACRSKPTMGVVIVSDQRPMLQPGPNVAPYGYGLQPMPDQTHNYGQGQPPPMKV